MPKPTIVTRSSKGSALTWTEGDANLENLRDATITVKAGTGGTDIVSDLNGTLTLVAGTNISLSGDNTAKTITITSTASGGATTLDGLSDVNTSGVMNGHTLQYNSTAGEWQSVLSSSGASTLNELTDVNTSGASNNQLLSYNSSTSSWEPRTVTSGISSVSSDTSPALGGALDVNGNSIVSTSNGNIVLEPNGTGDVHLNADTVRIGDLNTSVTLTSNSGALDIRSGSTNSLTLISGSLGLSLNTWMFSNSNITISPDGTGQTLIKNLEYNENVFSLGTTSGTIAPNAANGNVQTITLNGNLTINAFTSPVSGQTITLIINTGGTGRTLTSTMLFAGGSKTLSTTNTTDILTISYIGTTYYASLVKGYA